MKAYVTVTGILFAIIVLLHISRTAVEGFAPFKEPLFVLSSLSCAALSVWAWRVRTGLSKS